MKITFVANDSCMPLGNVDAGQVFKFVDDDRVLMRCPSEPTAAEITFVDLSTGSIITTFERKRTIIILDAELVVK